MAPEVLRVQVMTNTANSSPVKVTAIVLTCNRPLRCVDSVWHNTLAMQGLDAETIVVNNGTKPVSLPPAIAGMPCRVLEMPANIGAAARNAGIRAAAGEILLVLDDDAYMDPLLASKAVDAFNAKPDMGALAFSVRNSEDEDEACLLPSVFHGCACCFRKSAIVRAGGYPDDYLYYGASNLFLSYFWYAQYFNDANFAKTHYNLMFSKIMIKHKRMHYL